MVSKSQWDGPGTLTPDMTLLAAVVLVVAASVAGDDPCCCARYCQGTIFWLDLLHRPLLPAPAAAAAVMAALLCQITCPSGSRSARAGLCRSSGSDSVRSNHGATLWFLTVTVVVGTNGSGTVSSYP